jgi:hypothetical protein
MSIFKQLIKSIYSPKDIAKLRHQGIGKTILYIFLLTLIATLPAAIHLSTAMNTGLNEAKLMVAENLPSFTIAKGELHTSAKEPLIIQKKDFTFIIDGSGNINSTDLEDYHNAFALLQHKVVLITQDQPQSFEYSTLEGINITDQEIKSFIKNFQSMLPIFIPLMILFLYIFTSATKFIEVTFFALIALILKNTLARKLKFRHVWTLSAYSITLSTIFFTIMDAFMISVPFSVFLTWFINITILYLALKEIPKRKSQE